jgi:LPS-assembly lipoprotein
MKRLVLLALTLALGGCGLRPLYQGGSNGVVAQALSGIELGPIAGQSGWLVRDALAQRISRAGDAPNRYRLDVVLDDQITGFGIRSNNSVTRERRTLRARYKLVDLSNQQVLLDHTAGSDVGIDVVTSEYAVIAAEQTALERLSSAIADQIVARVALYASRNPTPQ